MIDPFASVIASGTATELHDVPAINAEASQEIFDRIEDARWGRDGAGATKVPPTRCILVLGSAGAGKTHLVDRVRARYGEGKFAVPVLYRPETGADGTLRSVHTALFDALQHKPGTWTQASLIAGSILAGANGANPELPTSFLNQPKPIDQALVNKGIEEVRRRSREVWPEYLDRFLKLPSLTGPDAWAHETWLAAREPSEAELGRVGEAVRPEGERNGISDAEVPRALRTLVAAASTVMPVVIFADQLELLVEAGGDAQRIRDHVKLFTTLRDTVPGLVLVQMALEREWLDRIRSHMSRGEQDRLEESVHHLHYPTLDQRRALIRARIDSIPEELREGQFPWPLTPDELTRILAVERRTPRAVLQLCSAAVRGQAAPTTSANGPEPPRAELRTARLDEAYQRYTDEARAQIDLAGLHGRGVDAPLLQDSIRTALGLVDGVETQPLKLSLGSAVAFGVRRGDHGVEVVVGQHSNGRSFSATVDLVLRALTEKKKTVLVREHDVGVPPTWDKSVKTLGKIQASWPGAFLELGRREVTALLATQRLLAAVQSQDLLDDAGDPIPTAAAREWLKARPDTPFPALADQLLASPVPTTGEAESPPKPRPRSPSRKDSAPEPRKAAAPSPGDPIPLVGDLLRELRVASIDGLARRLIEAGFEVPRSDVVKALRARADVRWFGETLVAVKELR
ncbi:MAG: hypothetical protein ABJE95_19210 [Byssovorax sp.]